MTLWKLSRRNFQFPLTWNNIKKVTFKNTFPKLGKNAIFFLPKQEQVLIEPAVEIEPSV